MTNGNILALSLVSAGFPPELVAESEEWHGGYSSGFVPNHVVYSETSSFRAFCRSCLVCEVTEGLSYEVFQNIERRTSNEAARYLVGQRKDETKRNKTLWIISTFSTFDLAGAYVGFYQVATK